MLVLMMFGLESSQGAVSKGCVELHSVGDRTRKNKFQMQARDIVCDLPRNTELLGDLLG